MTYPDQQGAIVYQYKADGNVKQITAPGSVTTTMTYDTYGNQLTLADPSAGSSSYTYYGGGELRTQVTPLGTTTRYYKTDGRDSTYTNPAGVYTYTYGANKLVSGITSPGNSNFPTNVSRSYTYYSNGKVNEISETIESGQTNKVTFVYDSYGRVSSKTYTNSDNATRTEGYVYNSYGYLDQVTFNGTVVYDVSTMNVRGQITAASIGGNAATWGYNSYGQLTSSAASGVQGYTYTPNTTTGNLTSRSNSLRSLTESFGYDTSDRLTSVTGTNALTLTYDTDGKGNIATKSDAGTLVYDLSGKPYAVRHVNPYDTINFPSASQTINYTSFGKVYTIAEGTYSASFKYNADNERVKMVLVNGTNTKTKYYFGGSYEKVIEGGVTTEYIWIGGDPYTAVAVAKISGGVTTVYSIFRDNLGTMTHLKTGSTSADEYSFDAFGRRRSADDWNYTLDANDKALFADRGFTGHEYLGPFGLYNMNGRLYDPLVGRFLSPDNYVQSPDNTQSFNRYGYCVNNPLKYTDKNGDAFGIDDVAEIVVGGVINIITNANKIDNFWEGLSYFAVGGISTWVTCQSFGAAASVGGAISGFGNSLLETNFLTKENHYSFKSITGSEWKDIAIKTGISAGAGLIGGWAGDKTSKVISKTLNVKSAFWNKAISQMSVNGISTSLELYGNSIFIDKNEWNSKEAFSDLGIGFGAGVLSGFTQTFLVDKWAIPELQKLDGLIKNLKIERSNWWNNLIQNSYNSLTSPYRTILPASPNQSISLPINNN